MCLVSYTDRERQRAYQREWAAERRAAVIHALGGKCAICGSTSGLEVDHIDRSRKVSHRVASWSVPRTAKELAKCQLLCREHHYAKTRAEFSRPITHGTAQGYRRGCRCTDCGAANRAYRRRGGPRKTHACSACGASGHNAKTCSRRRA